MAWPFSWLLGKSSEKPGASKPARRVGRSYYSGASKDRLHYGLRTTSVGPNAVTALDLPTLRARCRALSRNSGYGRKAVDVLANALVGDGIRPQSATGSKGVDRRVEALWSQFVRTADASGSFDVYGLQRQLVEAWIESGEVLMRRRFRSLDDALPVPVQIEALESEMIADSINLSKSSEWIQGVRFDARGRRIAYRLYVTHPGETGTFAAATGQTVEVDAANVSHVYDARRPGQVRGLPWLSPVLDDLGALDTYLHYEAERQIVQSAPAAFVTNLNPDNDPGLGEVEYDADAEEYLDNLQPATVRRLDYGEDVKFSAPQVSQGLDAYSAVVLRKVATGARIPYELLTGDLSGVNFSSIRTGMLEFRRMIAATQRHIVFRRVCQPMWDWFIASAIASGALPPRKGGYPVTWHAPRPVPIDRKKEAEADGLELKLGLNSLSGILRSRSLDPSEVIAEITKDAQALAAAGIKLVDVPQIETDEPKPIQNEPTA